MIFGKLDDTLRIKRESCSMPTRISEHTAYSSGQVDANNGVAETPGVNHEDTKKPTRNSHVLNHTHRVNCKPS